MHVYESTYLIRLFVEIEKMNYEIYLPNQEQFI